MTARTATPRAALRRRATTFGLVVAWLLLALIWSTAWHAGEVDGVHLGRGSGEGVGTVLSCEEYGPVSRYGFGNGDVCKVEVAWRDGGTSIRTADPAQFDASQIGRQFPVLIQHRPRTGHSPLVIDDHPTYLMVSISVAAVSVVVLFLGGLNLLARVFPGRRKPAIPPKGDAVGAWWHHVADEKAAFGSAPRPWPVTDRSGTGFVARHHDAFALVALWEIVSSALATIPYFDAPRSDPFVSRWPQIADIRLLGTPTAVQTLAAVVVLMVIMSSRARARTHAARLVTYGDPYLLASAGRELKVRRRRKNRQPTAHTVMSNLERESPRRFRRSRVLGAVIVVVGAAAVVHGIASLPDGAPFPVVLACLGDRMTLLLLGIAIVVTAHSEHEHTVRLMEMHQARKRATAAVAPHDSNRTTTDHGEDRMTTNTTEHRPNGHDEHSMPARGGQ